MSCISKIFEKTDMRCFESIKLCLLIMIPFVCEGLKQKFNQSGNFGMYGVMMGITTARNLLYAACLFTAIAWYWQENMLTLMLFGFLAVLSLASAMYHLRTYIPYLLVNTRQ